MMQAIVLLTPAAAATLIWEHFSVKKAGKWVLLRVYATFTGIINMLCMGVIAVVFKHPEYVINASLLNVRFAFRYLALSFALAVILNIAWQLLKKIGSCFDIHLEVENIYDHNEKQEK